MMAWAAGRTPTSLTWKSGRGDVLKKLWEGWAFVAGIVLLLYVLKLFMGW